MNSSVDRDSVALRAYQIYLENGKKQGSDLHNWLQAENELLNQKPQKKISSKKKIAS